MNRPELNLTEADGLEALGGHAVERALAARAKYGPRIDGDALRRMLADPEVVRFPTRLHFDGEQLQAGEFAWAAPLGERPADGFLLILHPALESRPDDWPLCAAYHLVSINYLDVATSREAELFGAALFGMEGEDYYRRLCLIADSLPGSPGADGYVLPGVTAEPPVDAQGPSNPCACT